MLKKRLIPSRPPGVVVGISLILLIATSQLVDGLPTFSSAESLMEMIENSGSSNLGRVLNEKEEIDDLREESLEKLHKIFGIRGQISTKSVRQKIPPQFMMELYNTIADPSGVTRGKNPYNAKIVRSFVERDSWLPQLYMFNLSGLEINESVIEAELHLYRKRSVLKVIHPTILRSPYYLIRVYQVLKGQSMDEPDVHRLLNVHYVGAHASGWQVFNVKQAVLAWIGGAPNLGLMVTASTLFGDVVSIEFARRDENHHSKQPILVLFNDDGGNDEVTGDKIHGVPHYYTYNDDDDDDDNEDDEKREEENDAFVRNETGDDRSDIEESEGNVDSELVDDFQEDNGRTVDRRKRQDDEAIIEEPKEIEGGYEKSELNKERSYGTQVKSKIRIGETEVFVRDKRIDGAGQSFVERQEHDENDGKTAGVYRRKRQQEEIAIEEPKETAAGDEKSELNKERSDGSQVKSKLRIGETEVFVRDKRIDGRGQSVESQAIENDEKAVKTTDRNDDNLQFVTRKKSRVQQVLSSINIYERAILRQEIEKNSGKLTVSNESNERKDDGTIREAQNNYKHKGQKRFPREAEREIESSKNYVQSRDESITECTRHELYVDFKDVGLSNSIIAPKGYSAFHCQGRCDRLPTHDQQITNHAAVQAIVHGMRLAEDLLMPCCVPTKLLGTSVLFFDEHDNVVLKVYKDMVAASCGCR